MITIVLLILFTSKVVFSVCPPKDLLSPCYCDNDDIICDGNSVVDIVPVFESLYNDRNDTQRHYDSIYINNTLITEIKANSFKDFTFDEIYIENNSNLTHIDHDAFNGTEQ